MPLFGALAVSVAQVEVTLAARRGIRVDVNGQCPHAEVELPPYGQVLLAVHWYPAVHPVRHGVVRDESRALVIAGGVGDLRNDRGRGRGKRRLRRPKQVDRLITLRDKLA